MSVPLYAVHSVVAGVEQYVIESAGAASRGRSGDAVARRAKVDKRRDLMETILVDLISRLRMLVADIVEI
jgi:hypothetical protein